jgi:hypothetical protein
MADSKSFASHKEKESNPAIKNTKTPINRASILRPFRVTVGL